MFVRQFRCVKVFTCRPFELSNGVAKDHCSRVEKVQGVFSMETELRIRLPGSKVE